MGDDIDVYGLPVWPAPERNKEPIYLELARLFPSGGSLLEIASGTGQHAEHFARRQSTFQVIPSDCDPKHLENLKQRALRARVPNLHPPLVIDVSAPPEAFERDFDIVYCANMVHIAPIECAEGLFAWAARNLSESGTLVTYGPYSFDGDFGAESNRAFHASLISRDPRWGIRDITELQRFALRSGFELIETVAMPANNHLLVWRLREHRALAEETR